MTKKIILFFLAMLCIGGTARAKVDLVTLPDRDSVQLTIYNSADLTLVRESRALTLKEGVNRLQFSWENTLIDPTSLEMLPKAQAGEIDISDLTFPPRVRNLGVFEIQSRISGQVPVEIAYLTSGLSWRAFYTGTLSKDETSMRLQGYVRVANRSGEDYDNAQTRLVVGKIHLLDEIAELARRQYPYGRPEPEVVSFDDMAAGRQRRRVFEVQEEKMMAMPAVAGAPKEIAKESLSEYFLYTIEGRETIENQWAKRLPSFDVADVPVENLYKYEEERFGQAVVRFLKFANDEDHKLGQTPIPDGQLKVYRLLDEQKRLSYEGHSAFKYVPVGEEAELDMGPVANVIVKPVLMKYETRNHAFYKNGDISGWDEATTYKVEVKNTRDIPVAVEVWRNIPADAWDLETPEGGRSFEKVDKDTVKFVLAPPAKSKEEFSYTLVTYHGTRAENR